MRTWLLNIQLLVPHRGNGHRASVGRNDLLLTVVIRDLVAIFVRCVEHNPSNALQDMLDRKRQVVVNEHVQTRH
jgi:hypothetical protein